MIRCGTTPTIHYDHGHDDHDCDDYNCDADDDKGVFEERGNNRQVCLSFKAPFPSAHIL